MASAVKFGKFEWDRAGYARLMDTGAVDAVVAGKAQKVLAAADRGLGEDGYRHPGHEIKKFSGVLAPGYVVRTKTDHARYAQAKRKNLTKALGSAKG